jgi:hypothetical protein
VNRPRTILAAAIATLGVVTACGDDDDDPTVPAATMSDTTAITDDSMMTEDSMMTGTTTP